MRSTEHEPDEVWYKDESNEFQEQLKAYEHMVCESLVKRDLHKDFLFIHAKKDSFYYGL